MSVLKHCVVCGKEFEHWNDDFCSPKCFKQLRKH